MIYTLKNIQFRIFWQLNNFYKILKIIMILLKYVQDLCNCIIAILKMQKHLKC